MSTPKPTTNGDHYELTPDQQRTFVRDGYLVLAGFLSEEELAPIEELYEHFKSGAVPGMGRDFCDMSGPYDRPFAEFNIINCVLPRRYDKHVAGNVFERRAESVARQLIGSDATLDYDQHLSKKPGRDGAMFAWHQDLGYWPTGTPDTRTTTCSLALDDATLENGCLQVVPGSHLEEEIRPHTPIIQSTQGLREETHALSIDLRTHDRLVSLPVKRGDITVHNERIIHGSGGNPTERWRRTYIIAHRSKATVDYERSIGFTHSHNDKVQWQTHLEALES
jgi:phytanoyl-CoA hydroxylase